MALNLSGLLKRYKPTQDYTSSFSGGFNFTPAPTAAAPTSTPATSAGGSAPFGGRYTLDMDPEVVMALAYEHQGLSDLGSAGGGPTPPSTAQYDLELRHLQELAPIQRAELERTHSINTEGLNHSNELAKRAIINNLAARGMLRSGETPYMQGEQARAYGIGHEAVEHDYTTGLATVDRNIRWQTEAVTAARAAANSAYASAQADYARGLAVDKRQLHERVITAYVNAYQRVIENPALYLGADPSFDPRKFLGQIPA